MGKCYFGVITFWHRFTGWRLSWSLDFFHHLCNCDTNTLGSPIVIGFSIGFSTSLSISELDLTTLNVSDGVYCISFGNYVPRELEASPNVDISVSFKTLILKKKKN